MTFYFDNAATTKIKPEVLKEMMPYLTEEYGNPSSLYSIGRNSKRVIDTARKEVASLINCEKKEIYFTTNHPYESDVILDVNEYDLIPEMNSISYKTELLKNIDFKLDNGFYTDMEYAIIPLPHVKNFIFIK